jgi:hypothetical protein
MRIIVGGQSRKAGKTTLVCRLIGALPQFEWTVVKISGHTHGLEGAAYDLKEETAHDAAGDTRRYLDAGARHAWWLRGDLEQALPALRACLESARDWIVESTSAIGLIECDAVLLAVAEGKIKEAAKRSAERAHALVRIGGMSSLSAPGGVRLYDIGDPALLDFVLRRGEGQRNANRIARSPDLQPESQPGGAPPESA